MRCAIALVALAVVAGLAWGGDEWAVSPWIKPSGDWTVDADYAWNTDRPITKILLSRDRMLESTTGSWDAFSACTASIAMWTYTTGPNGSHTFTPGPDHQWDDGTTGPKRVVRRAK